MKPDSPKETACLDRARIWEELIGWCEEMGKSDQFYCGNLRVSLTIGLCNAARREAKRRVLFWPEGLGWMAVCAECPVIATEGQIPAASPKAGCAPLSSPTLISAASNDVEKIIMAGKTRRTAGGDARPTNQKPKTKNQKRLLKTMSRAVARDLGLI